MNWFTGKAKVPTREVQIARAQLADAERRLQEARKTREVSEAVKLDLQELRAEDHFTSTIFPRRGQ